MEREADWLEMALEEIKSGQTPIDLVSGLEAVLYRLRKMEPAQ